MVASGCDRAACCVWRVGNNVRVVRSWSRVSVCWIDGSECLNTRERVHQRECVYECVRMCAAFVVCAALFLMLLRISLTFLL